MRCTYNCQDGASQFTKSFHIITFPCDFHEGSRRRQENPSCEPKNCDLDQWKLVSSDSEPGGRSAIHKDDILCVLIESPDLQELGLWLLKYFAPTGGQWAW